MNMRTVINGLEVEMNVEEFIQYQKSIITETPKKLFISSPHSVDNKTESFFSDDDTVKLTDMKIETPEVTIHCLSEDKKKIFFELVADIIKNGGKITYRKDSIQLGITDASQWRLFCDEFKVKSDKIAEHFNVENYFCVVKYGSASFYHIEYKRWIDGKSE